MAKNWLIPFRRVALVLAALAQFVPANAAFASDDGEFKIVFCTPEGAQTIDWEGATGDSSPFSAPADDPSHTPCHACLTSCRVGAAIAAVEVFLPNVSLCVAPRADIAPKLVLMTRAVGPPLPSRSPPTADA